MPSAPLVLKDAHLVPAGDVSFEISGPVAGGRLEVSLVVGELQRTALGTVAAAPTVTLQLPTVLTAAEGQPEIVVAFARTVDVTSCDAEQCTVVAPDRVSFPVTVR